MAKHRAVIIGAGRIGAGYNWPPHPFVYTHADAYLKLKDRVELGMFLETDPVRGLAAQEKYGIPASGKLLTNLETGQYDIASVCVHPDVETHRNILKACIAGGIKGIWWEKPFMLAGPLPPDVKIQVNYIRRFDTLHNSVKGELDSGRLGAPIALVVMAKKDIHTECHFNDLALWWDVPLGAVVYADTTGTEYVNTEYELICKKGKVKFFQGGMSAQLYGVTESKWFPGSLVPHSNGQVSARDPKIFMEVALSNLLDAVEGKAELKSPPY